MANDREEALKKAEKLLRQGKLDGAIAEYVRVVEENPRDWNTTNTLGDLHVRAGQIDKAVIQYTKIAEHLMHEGFYPRAGAQFKKILKIKPDDESAQLNLAEISAKQGLLADAKAYFTVVASRRRARGDAAGADEIIVRLGSLDPSDIDARIIACRVLEQGGDAILASMGYRALHADLMEKGRVTEAQGALREAVRLNPDDPEGRMELARAAVAAGDLEAAKPYLDRTVAGENPTLLLPLMEIELRTGHYDAAREILSQLLAIDENLRTRIVELAWTLAETSPEAAFVCIDTAVDAALAKHNYMDAAAMLQEFVTRVSGQISPLLKLVEICVDGGLEAAMYETQAQLADAYLEAGQGAEARVIAEDLVAREPWDPAHIERFRRALVMLNVPDPDTLIAERLSGQGPFVATDPFMASESLVDGDTIGPMLRPYGSDPTPPRDAPVAPDAPPAAQDAVAAPAPKVKLETSRAEPSAPPPPAPPANPSVKEPSRALDIDLGHVLAELHGMTLPAAPPQAAPGPSPASPAADAAPNLDEVFGDFRAEISRQTGASDASEQFKLAQTYLEMGMADEAITALAAAARSPHHRFEASSILGRLYLKRKDLVHAIEWLERAAEAPAPSADDTRQLLYDLGVVLEALGETSRALAVFLELQSDAAEFRDVAARVDRLSKVQTGG